MKRRLPTVLILILAAVLPAAGQGGWYAHLDYGVEWGYTASFCDIYHYNYTSPTSGARIDSRDTQFAYKSNGYLSAFVGARFARVLALDAVAGWAGVYEGRRVFPLTLRSSVFWSGYERDGWKTFLEGGCCAGKSFAGKPIWMAKMGSGYRILLDRYFALDLMFSLQGVHDHPMGIFDKSRGESVPDKNLRRSDCNYLSANFSVALCF